VVKIPLDGDSCPPQHEPVPVAVERDFVPGCGDLGRDRRPALHLLSDEEERRRRPRGREHLESGRCPLRMRAVIERQRDAGVVPDPHGDPEGFRHEREHGCRGGCTPRRREAEAAVDPRAHFAIVPQSRRRRDTSCAVDDR